MGHSQNIFWLLANLLGFQLIWWALVLFGNQAVIPAVVLLAIHFYLVSDRALEYKLVALIGLGGFATDYLLTELSVWQFPEGVAPLWLAVLWCCFAATLRHSLRPLWPLKRWLPALGALGGVSSYLGAHQLGAVSLGHTLMLTGLVCGLLWAAIFPLCVWLCRTAESREISHAK